MAKSQDTFNKKEKEKKRLQKRKEKEQRKEERKSNSGKGDQIAYVDEYGNITSTPTDNFRKSSVKLEDIELGSRNKGGTAAPGFQRGRVSFYNSAKGFGFIKNEFSGESVFFHSKSVDFDIKEGDNVTYEAQMGERGPAAGNVKKG